MDVKTLILGAGAAGLFCAAHAGAGTLVIDHAANPGEKIRISGGGRCNFTNLGAGPGNFLSANRHFAKSALSRYTPRDFVTLVDRHGIAWHEKTLGQLFCDGSARQIVSMLLEEVARAGADLWLSTTLREVAHDGSVFRVVLEREGARREVRARHLVLATGGKSIPKMGATGLALEIAAQFGLGLTETRPGLVPFTFPEGRFAALAGVAVPARVAAGKAAFDEALLFTHRGLSGPAVLQASSYWREGGEVAVNLLPGQDALAGLKAARSTAGKRSVSAVLAGLLPARLAEAIAAETGPQGNIADQSDRALASLAARLTDWRLRPGGTEGYRTAEVMVGGVDTRGLDGASMEARAVPGLFVIGEAVDVTGWLGGYNFQWAWASAHAAGRAIAARP
ncbi:MAG: aminoacetone oxidase family FAD-binding enzyme [Limimaricola sp.]|uniref:NAD(P)/FAD-dependent oxidoreductase n=1 Tax=Limimaricola sp. TaxID=2211665 RepID=UPI001DCCE6D7|nr:NAD(P)/FAD-dependent oxidoreductase [Limimaricola sp.]MBI1418580.1 aminoacetone oxidase family FAD-binding enzyme [Limimaricola sp.]